MAGFDDGQVKFGIKAGFICSMAFAMRHFHFLKQRLDHLQIHIRGKTSGPAGGQTFHIASERQVIKHRFIVIGKQFNQNLRKCAA